MVATQQRFGGDWTAEKLERVKKYLAAYAKIMTKQRFRFAYVDAFAGTGYRTMKEENSDELMLPEFAEQDAEAFLEGSARIALQVKPRFTRYIFIEKDQGRFDELNKLKNDFPGLQKDIVLVNAEANEYLNDLCQNYRWDKHRAVLFLDPYGMQVTWNTVEAIAKTKAIDLWYLFPLGVAVNRLLKKDDRIDEVLKKRLDKIFGTTKWYEAFYKTETATSLFGEQAVTKKVANMEAIGQYFVKRMQKIFASVADNPLPLYNSRRNPLYLLCFASGNPKGATTAVKIAQDILAR